MTALILRSTVGLAVVGIAIGALGAGVGRRLISGLIGIQTFDVTLFAVAATLTMATAMAAVYLPARRAARSEPVAILRE